MGEQSQINAGWVTDDIAVEMKRSRPFLIAASVGSRIGGEDIIARSEPSEACRSGPDR
jgi:hypothetical protein